MNKTVIDIISFEQLRALREAGFVVVHREPTDDMCKCMSGSWPETWNIETLYHRMVGMSIRIQNKEIDNENNSSDKSRL